MNPQDCSRHEFFASFYFYCGISSDIYHCNHHIEAISDPPKTPHVHNLSQSQLPGLPGMFSAYGLFDPLFFGNHRALGRCGRRANIEPANSFQRTCIFHSQHWDYDPQENIQLACHLQLFGKCIKYFDFSWSDMVYSGYALAI
jgi:hypothetical protein